MIYTLIHTIHLLSAFVYGGFLFADYLFLSKMPQSLTAQEHAKARESFMIHVRKVVPYALFIAVGSGLYLLAHNFGPITNRELTGAQTVMLMKAYLGLWLGLRGFNQKIFKIDPWIFKSHKLPFFLVLSVIVLSQFIWFEWEV
ncbi:MAG: hypothetical protein AB7D43_05270 [Sulfurimonadaceae bacterium]